MKLPLLIQFSSLTKLLSLYAVQQENQCHVAFHHWTAFASSLSKCWGFCREKSVFSLMCVGKLLPRQNWFHNIHLNFWINYCKKWKNPHFYTLTEWIPIIVIISHSLDPSTPYFKGEEVNFDYLPRRGLTWKIKKGGGSIVLMQVFLKVAGGASTFPF